MNCQGEQLKQKEDSQSFFMHDQKQAHKGVSSYILQHIILYGSYKIRLPTRSSFHPYQPRGRNPNKSISLSFDLFQRRKKKGRRFLADGNLALFSSRQVFILWEASQLCPPNSIYLSCHQLDRSRHKELVDEANKQGTKRQLQENSKLTRIRFLSLFFPCSFFQQKAK